MNTVGLSGRGGGSLGRKSPADDSSVVSATSVFVLTQMRVAMGTKVGEVNRTERAKEVLLNHGH